MTAQVLFSNVFSEEDPHLNAVEHCVQEESSNVGPRISSNLDLEKLEQLWLKGYTRKIGNICKD